MKASSRQNKTLTHNESNRLLTLCVSALFIVMAAIPATALRQNPAEVRTVKITGTEEKVEISGDSINIAEAATTLLEGKITDPAAPLRESLFPKASLNLLFSHFTWGAEIGCTIDLTSQNTSTFDVDAMFGYKNDYVKMAGIGAGIHRSFGADNLFVPVYVVFRSSFRKKPSLLFFSFKGGYSFNTIAESPIYGDVSASLGLGFNLTNRKSFKSHIVISWAFRHFTENHKIANNLDSQNINLANIAFGVNF